MARPVELAAGAAMGTHERQFAAFFVVQVDVGIQASEGLGDLVDDLINQLVEVKDGTDFLSGLLQLEKLVYLIEMKRARVGGKRCREAWTGCHGSAPGKRLPNHR